jgi:hypothetical protein
LLIVDKPVFAGAVPAGKRAGAMASAGAMTKAINSVFRNAWLFKAASDIFEYILDRGDDFS